MKTRQVHPIPAGLVRGLYDHYGWWPERSLEDIQRVIDEGPAVGAWMGEQLIGFARGVTDGVFRAYVEDVLVHPDYRTSGVATKLLALLMTELGTIDVVSLFCSPDHERVYRRAGFQRRGDIVMHRYRVDREPE